MNKYVKRYFIDAMSGMAQGLFASLLIGTIIKTIGQQLLRLSDNVIFQFFVNAGNFATDAHVVGAAMAIGIGFAMEVPALVLFSLAAVGSAANVTGGAGGPLAVLIIAIIAAELGRLVSKKTKVDIIVTPAVTIGIGVLFSLWWAPAIGKAIWAVAIVIHATHIFIFNIFLHLVITLFFAPQKSSVFIYIILYF